MADRAWPPALRFSDASWQIVGNTRSGGQSLNGQEQIAVSPAGRWRASVTIPIADRRSGPADRQDAVLAFRSLVHGGRAATILLPCRDGRGPAHRASIVPCGGDVTHSDGALFSDGAGYGQSFSGASFAAAAALNATQVQIRVGAGLQLLPGMRFSTPDGRLHEVGEVVSADGAGLWVVRILPWLRAAYAVNTPLEFDRPVCRMRLSSDEVGGLSLILNRFGTASLDFSEAF